MHDIIIKSGIINKHIGNSSNVIVQTFNLVIKKYFTLTSLYLDIIITELIVKLEKKIKENPNLYSLVRPTVYMCSVFYPITIQLSRA